MYTLFKDVLVNAHFLCTLGKGHELQKLGIYWGNGSRREMRDATIRDGG